MQNIRNFCIIAHIDHGKSTLADRFLEITGTVEKRKMRQQYLDTMELERERGITIKLQPVRMEYRGFILNLIDTPGHVDFTYEVSRSLQAVEGAILLVDATQGVEAQTLSNLYLALEQNLVIIPVVNKIDLAASSAEKSKKELSKLLGVNESEILLCSGKTGEGVEDILKRIIERVPAPAGSVQDKAQALIFDSKYDDYRGVVAYIRVFSGQIKKHDKIIFLGANQESQALELGYFKPDFQACASLSAGEIGYVVTSFKDVAQARVGDTITLSRAPARALPGYRDVKPMVFAGLYPQTGDDYPRLKEALGQVKLTDASLQYESEHSPALGFGFRCGFLGMLHLEIIAERLRREHNLSLLVTTPSVAYQALLKNGQEQVVGSPLSLPAGNEIMEIKEPWAKIEIVAPKIYIGPIIQLAQNRHGIVGETEYLDQERVILKFSLPLAGIITDFYDRLKNVTSGYGSLNYELSGYRPADIVRLDILVADEPIEAFSVLARRADAYDLGKKMVTKLKEIIPRHQFMIKLQAALGGKIIAAERLPALRKDVTAKLYGGDVTRKRKLLEKQKKGKKKMLSRGKVNIPDKAFLEILRRE